MSPADLPGETPAIADGEPAIHCDACQAAVEEDGEHDVSFLLLDHLTLPVVSCEDHREQFASICALTTEDTADLLGHPPAGGIRCPACRNAPHSGSQPVIPVRDGALALLACPQHQAEITQRFRSGLATHQQLTSSFESASNPLE